MRLDLVVVAPVDTAPDDPTVLAELDSAAARQASIWTTTPVYAGTTDGSDAGLDLPDTSRLLHYVTDAQPRVTAVTTSSISPALLPPHVT